MRRALLLATLLFAGLAGPAAAQIPPPSLVTDTGFAFAGVSEYDLNPFSADEGQRAAVDPALDRWYGAGSSANRMAVVARRSDGSLDGSFDGDGAVGLTLGTAVSDIVVLPDHHLRLLGPAPTSGVVIVGLNPDGSFDSGFGQNGLVSLPGDFAGGLAVDALGRLAITGGVGGDTFITVRNADGSGSSP